MASPTFEGETQVCHCKTELVARMTVPTDGYPPKLQWQNPDGTAHYKFNAGTKKFECRIPQSNDGSATQTNLNQSTRPAQVVNPSEALMRDLSTMHHDCWDMAFARAKEFYKIPLDVVTTEKDVLILAEVFYKELCNAWVQLA